MEIWIDSCNKRDITEACSYGFIYGVTTNPSLLADVKEDHEKLINTLLDIQDGPVALQIVSDNVDEIVHRALTLHAFSDRIVVKIPVTQNGLIAIKQLSEEKVCTMATALFNPNQALLAALAGADYIAPYIGRMYDVGLDGYSTLKTIVSIYTQYNFKTKILAAALKSTEHIVFCAELGVHAITLKRTLFNQWVANDEYTNEAVQTFNEDWESRKNRTLSTLVL